MEQSNARKKKRKKGPDLDAIAKLVVRTLDLASPQMYPLESEIGSDQLRLAARIMDLYSANKRTMDFTQSAYAARVQVVREILEEKFR